MFRPLMGVISILGWLVGWCATTLAAPFGVGNLLLPYNASKVAEINPQTGSENQELSITLGTFATDVNSLRGGGIARDGSGRVYVTVKQGDDNKIVRFNADGTNETVVITKTASTFDFRGIEVGNDGKFYVATDSGIRIYNPDGGETILDSSGAYRDVAFDSQGNLYGLKRTDIVKWSKGNFSGSGTSLNLQGLTAARALVFDSADRLFVTSSSSVFRYEPSGDGYNTTPTEIAINNTVFGIAYDWGIDMLYVVHTSSSTNQILKFRPTDNTATSIANTSGYSGPRWLEVVPTPEPATWLLFGVGAGAALWRWRRQRR